MDQVLSVYLPLDRCHALAMGTTLPERTQGAALFVDISGFTAMTEALTRELGPRRGAEELPPQMNLGYDALIQEADRYGGSVIGFAGDAMTCWFDGDTGLRATTCGLAMQEAMRAFATIALPSGSTASLAVKVAVASGMARRFLVGDPSVQVIETLAGTTLTRMAAAEQLAAKGEVVLDEATAHALAERLRIESWRTDKSGARFAVVAGLHESAAPHPWPPLAPGGLSSEQLRPWLLPVVYERLHAGQGEFLTELRPAVALFLRFEGIDYEIDPTAGEKLDLFIRWVQRLLVQYEGTLIQLTLGGKSNYLYAAFGAPIAHEDDDLRAALTALALRTPPEALSFISDVRIGLTRGTMRSGAYGGTTRRTYGALGDEVNLAARLMQHAPPGQIIANRHVQAATEALFRWQSLGEIRVKGKSAPIPVFALLDQAQSSSIHLTGGTHTLPMIGREAELALVEAKLRLVRRGQGQVVGITAEAGLGKSRLVAEVIRLAQAQGFTGYGGECESYGINIPYLVWHAIWRAFFGLNLADPPERQAEQLAQALTEMDAAVLPRLPLLGAAVGLTLPDNDLTCSFDPQLRKASREALLVDLLKSRARALGTRQGGLLLVLEDCHWLDPASHDLLEVVARAIWNLPVLVLLAYRPTELERLEAPRVSMLTHFTRLSLAELGEEEATHLLASRLAQQDPGDGRTPAATLIRQLAERAQGNPFYLEELLNYLNDEGFDLYEVKMLEQLALPPSLHSLILSRIDRLTERQKVTLKVASVVGRLFHLAWLLGYYPALGEAEAIRHDLEVMDRLDLTLLEQSEPELVYLFKHIITREVAYESLPYATRAHLHEQLALFLEQKEENAVEGHLDLLAYHYSLSENRDKTRYYLRRAGESAQAAYANSAAQDYYEQLLPLLTNKEEQLEIHLRLGKVLELVGKWEKAEGYYQSALALAPATGQAQCALALGTLYCRWGRYEQAQRWLTQALTDWEMQGAGRRISEVLAELGTVAYRQGDYARAWEYTEQARERCQREGDQQGLADALRRLGVVATNQGNYETARVLSEESLLLRREMGHKEVGNRVGIADALNTLGEVARLTGAYEEAKRYYEEGLAINIEIGHRYGTAIVLSNLGETSIKLGAPQAARTHYEESLVLCREMGNRYGIAYCLGNLGDLCCDLGAHGEARAYLIEGLEIILEVGALTVTLRLLTSIAKLFLLEGDPAQSLRLLGLILQHPACDSELRQQAEPLLAELQARLPAERVSEGLAQSQAQPLKEVAGALLRQLTTAPAGEAGQQAL